MATDTVLNTTIHTLQDLRHLPGYAGFRPQQQWRYGDTFGNDTAKYFQDKRTAQLKRSTAQAPGTEWDAKIAFPTVYSNDPKLVVGARTRERDRWLSRPQYQLFNRHDRDWEIHDFDKGTERTRASDNMLSLVRQKGPSGHKEHQGPYSRPPSNPT
ncbi:predicted protein [Nematostella vectensis]|uniref:Ciliary microtubule inner protein 2C n=1 Tax=Nematostella vectensis TaxID=45351 RepID=A7SUG6_NEMVE|nr:predicted protein [Nematostella vectensis]|eukprot:XP_001624745.1 predicted protein [Nematostella vectensis]